MRFLQHAFAALSFSLLATVAAAAPGNPQNGVDYRTLDKVQPTDSGNKVEVTEFFWYSCDHCNNFDQPLTAWVKKQGDNIVFKRVPVAFRDSFVPQQKLFYTLEAMGKLEQLHEKVFHTIHVERNRLDNVNAISEWAVKQGLDKQKFLDVFNSFGIQTMVARATQLQSSHRVEGVPMMAVDGRYLTSPSIVGSSMGRQPEGTLHVATFQVLDWLVARVSKEKGTSAAPVANDTRAKKQ